jgi:hypothetical protein
MDRRHASMARACSLFAARPIAPQTQGTIERGHPTFKNRILPRTSVPEAPDTSHII